MVEIDLENQLYGTIIKEGKAILVDNGHMSKTIYMNNYSENVDMKPYLIGIIPIGETNSFIKDIKDNY